MGHSIVETGGLDADRLQRLVIGLRMRRGVGHRRIALRVGGRQIVLRIFLVVDLRKRLRQRVLQLGISQRHSLELRIYPVPGVGPDLPRVGQVLLGSR